VIIDSSAVMAIVNDEPGADRLLGTAAGATCRMSVATWLEVSIVADARSTTHGERLDRIIDALEIEIVPVSRRDGEVARVAYRRYGRGSGSPARLNVGDCFACALSVTAGEPLLFTGDDFGHTDVAPVLRRAAPADTRGRIAGCPATRTTPAAHGGRCDRTSRPRRPGWDRGCVTPGSWPGRRRRCRKVSRSPSWRRRRTGTRAGWRW
jgi:ribonuclease VapC